MRFAERCFRGHDPGWSFSPLSGAGAAIRGGRFNRVGEPRLYLSLAIMTAIRECTQGLSNRLDPLTVCEYDVDCSAVADLRSDAGRARHAVTVDELDCAWLVHQRAGTQAPSWLVADRLSRYFHGMLVPSFAPGADPSADHNLVLWRWDSGPPSAVAVHDPSGRLPRNRLSWDP